MNLNELLETLDIQSEDDFIYFEQFSDLIEFDEEIEFDMFAQVLENVIPSALSEMTESFFDDLISGIPDDNVDLYTSMNDERELLMLLAGNSDHRREHSLYIDELYSFRKWYMFTKEVICKSLSSDAEMTTSVYDALILYRLEKLSGEKYDYDFSTLIPYIPDEYALSVSEELSELSAIDDNNRFDNHDDYGIMENNNEYDYDYGYEHFHDGDDDCDCDHEHGHIHDREIDPYSEGLVDRDNPVIDGVDYGD